MKQLVKKSRQWISYILLLAMVLSVCSPCNANVVYATELTQETTDEQGALAREDAATGEEATEAAEAVNDEGAKAEQDTAKGEEVTDAGETGKETATGEESAEADKNEEQNPTEENTEVVSKLPEKIGDVKDAFSVLQFTKLNKDKLLTVNSEEIKFDAKTNETGIIVSGKNADVKPARFVVGRLDFGTKAIQRVEVNAVASRATKTFFDLYLDDVAEPVASFQMYRQKKEDDWSQNRLYCLDLTGLNITGKHVVSFELRDETTKDDKKTKILLRSIQFVQETLPVVSISVDESLGSISEMNGDINHETECYGSMTISVPENYTSPYFGEGMDAYTGGTYSMDYIRGRGNSTWGVDKKPYKIKLDKKADLFNMGSNKHWVLLANYYDNSLVRNRMTYWLGQELGMPFTPQCVSVDVIMNNEYLGSYLLCEQVRVGESRVEIDDLEDAESITEDNITGGYLLGMSPYGDETGYAFTTNQGNMFYVESPESNYGTMLDSRMDIWNEYLADEGSDEGNLEDKWVDDSPYKDANAYIKNYVQDVEDAIYGEGFKNEAGVSYADLMDVDSAVAYYWIQEFSMNGDAFVSTSTYLYKERDQVDEKGKVIPGKLYWGPLWDFDYVAWASYDYSAPENSSEGFVNQRVWFDRLMEDPAFCAKVKDYWNTKLKPALEKVCADGGVLDQYEKELLVSANKNFDKWGFTDFGWGEDDYVDEEADEESEEIVQSFPYEIDRLKKWILARMNWIDNNLDLVAPVEIPITFMLDGKVYAETSGWSNREFNSFPENPKKKKMVFAGWYYTFSYIDEETGEQVEEENRLEADSWLFDGLLNEDGKFVVTGKWLREDEIVPIKEVVFEQKDYYTYYGNIWGDEESGYINLNYTFEPEDATFTDLEWSSENPEVAEVFDGFVHATGKGETKISATTTDGKSFSVTVHVLSLKDIMEGEYYLEDFELSETEIAVDVNGSKKLDIITYPEIVVNLDAEDGEYTWLSLDEDVATVSAGLVRGKKDGITTIIAINSMSRTIRYCKVIVGKGNANSGVVEKPNDVPVVDKNQNSQAGNNTNTTAKPDTPQNPTQKPEVSVKIGTAFEKDSLKYVVTGNTTGTMTVSVTGISKSKTKVVIPATVNYENKEFAVTEIAKNAFAKDKKLSKITIGANVTAIGSKAFYKAKKLSKIKIASGKLNAVGKNALKGINKKATITVAKDKMKAYKKLFTKKTGYKTSMKLKSAKK